MGNHYRQITIEERCEIARLQAAGHSVRQIASCLGRSPSTIAREIKRNRPDAGGYQARYADDLSRSRRWTGSKLDRDSELRATVLLALGCGWSPELIAGRLKRETGRCVVSYETIYRFIYGHIKRTRDYSWRHLLLRGKYKRGWLGRKGRSPASYIPLRCPISERTPAATDRQSPGHWEADLMQFKGNRQAILTLHDRRSRLLIAVRPPSKAAEPIAQALCDILAPLPAPWRQTVTFDNGTEFTQHYQLHLYDIETFFCDAYASWQKGGVENAIGRLRRRLPRKTDLTTISDEEFTKLVQAYNNTPRKCLDYRTPAEFFWEELLHFKRESSLRSG